MERLSPPFRSLALQVPRDLAGGVCVSIVGLSNTGKSLLLRSLAGEEAARTSAEVAAEGVHIDPDSGDVWVDGVRIPLLTDLEFRLLQPLYERRDKLTDKHRIVTAVWGEQYLSEVDRLRAQLEPDPANPRCLVTQRGRGYKLLSRPRATGTAEA